MAWQELTTAEHRQLSQHGHLVGFPVGCHKRPLFGVLRLKPRFPQTLKVHCVDENQPGEHTIDKIWGQQMVNHACEAKAQTREDLRTGGQVGDKWQWSGRTKK